MTQSTIRMFLLLLACGGTSLNADKRTHCKDKKSNTCQSVEDKRKHKKNNSSLCPTKNPELAFQAILTFDNILKNLRPRPENERPADPETGDHEVTGLFEICFAKDFSYADYRLTICNVNYGDRNRNEGINYAALVGGNVYFDITNLAVETPIAFIKDFSNYGETTCGQDGNICVEGRFINRSLSPNGSGNNNFSFITIAGLYAAIRSGGVTCLIGGSNGCDTRLPQRPHYGVDSFSGINGLIQGTVFPAKTIGLLAIRSPE